jgi:hypothetical protein
MRVRSFGMRVSPLRERELELARTLTSTLKPCTRALALNVLVA